MKSTYLKDLIGEDFEDKFLDFDLTEIQQVLIKLQIADAIDLPHAEMLQQQSLRGADILCEYLSKLVKVVSYLESKINTAKNKAALDYKSPDGSKVTLDMRKWASEIAPEVVELQSLMARAKGSKVLLEKKFDIIMKSHYYYRDIAAGLRKTILGYAPPMQQSTDPVPEGWE